MANPPAKLGPLGEEVAAKYLKKLGYKILDRNFSTSFGRGPLAGEIDIVARKKDSIFFVEVKSSWLNNMNAAFSQFSPENRVNPAKQKQLIKMALSWLAKRRIPLDSRWQIDVAAVIVDSKNKTARVRYFQNVVSLS